MKVKKISVANVEVSSLPKLLDEEKIGFQPVSKVNWNEYPYCPKVEFRVAHTEDAILLHFKVTEASVRARYGEDNGRIPVWSSSLFRPATESTITLNVIVSVLFLWEWDLNGTIANMLLRMLQRRYSVGQVSDVPPLKSV